MTIRVCVCNSGSGGSVSAAGNNLIISSSVTRVDSALLFAYFSETAYNNSGWYASSALHIFAHYMSVALMM